jgi:outer membrane protein, heavy metal efflux system
VSQSAGFNDVKANVGERIGLRAQWDRGSPKDEPVDEAVDKLLQSELTVAETGQIALLNNRGLQAVYEDLNLAQANVVQSAACRC